jgi:putative ABC transport system permease protein
MALTADGLLAGTLVALVVTRYMTTMLYGVEPYDPLTFGAVLCVLAAIALFACWVPARRAVAGNAVVALRE